MKKSCTWCYCYDDSNDEELCLEHMCSPCEATNGKDICDDFTYCIPHRTNWEDVMTIMAISKQIPLEDVIEKGEKWYYEEIIRRFVFDDYDTQESKEKDKEA